MVFKTLHSCKIPQCFWSWYNDEIVRKEGCIIIIIIISGGSSSSSSIPC
jgi:hypothetical protein